jgi:hypothetical protein
MSSSLDALAAAGVPVDSIAEEKRAVLAELTPEETQVLVGIVEKMSSEVEGFSFQLATPALKPEVRGVQNPGLLEDSGGLFW